MKRSKVQSIIVTIVAISLAIFISELFLRIVDPYGWMAWRAEQIVRYKNLISYPLGEGYRLDTGRYTVRQHHEITVLSDGSRLVIESNPSSDCRLVAIGDSMTFGSGVDDDVVWVNLWAGENDYEILNVGVVDTNAVEVSASRQRYPADGYVWLLWQNDAQNSQVLEHQDSIPFALALRYYLLPRPQIEREDDMPAFVAAVEAMAGEGVLIFAFEDELLLEFLPTDLPIIIIERYTAQVSSVDRHPDERGHQQIFDAMQNHLNTFTEEICS